jgi:hypothetical protein
MKLIIAISGKAGHGKDSLANIIKKNIGKEKKVFFDRICYADKLKDVSADLFSLDRSNLSDLDYKDAPLHHFEGTTPREILQVLGTDISRKLFGNIWVYHYEKRVVRTLLDNYHSTDDVIIFTPDLRFKNEYDALKEFEKTDIIDLKTCLIRISRPGFSIDIGKEHSSENGLDDVIEWDYSIEARDMPGLEEQGKTLSQLIIRNHF